MKRIVLNAGCGNNPVPQAIYPEDEWEEIRVDKDPGCSPSVVADLRDLPFPEDHFDSVWMCHVLEHFDYRSRHDLMRELHRVMKPGAFIFLLVPDLCSKPVLKALEDGEVTRVIYTAACGPISAEQVIFGQFYPGELEIHRCGYSEMSLRIFLSAHFPRVKVAPNNDVSLQAVAWKEEKPS